MAGFAYRRYKSRTEQSRKRALSQLEQNVSIRELFSENPGLYDASIRLQRNPMLREIEDSSEYMSMPEKTYSLVRAADAEPEDLSVIEEHRVYLEPDTTDELFYDETIEDIPEMNKVKLYQNPLAQRAHSLEKEHGKKEL